MRLVILDRDGVINHDSADFIKTPQEWVPISGSLEAIARLTRANYRVVVATNQSGLARGLLNIDTLNLIHVKMQQHLADLGSAVEAIFFCPHGPRSGCSCRKPEPGMFLDIAARLGLNSLQNVSAVGDSLRDLQAAVRAGAKPILVKTGKGQETLGQLPHAGMAHIPVYDNLACAVDALLEAEL